MLIHAAETIGSTLGAIAAKAEAASKALTGRGLVRKAEQITRSLNTGKLSSAVGIRAKRNSKRKTRNTGRGRSRRRE